MSDDMLIVEDLMLLMLDEATGAVAGAGTFHYTLGGAVLVELALRGRVAADQARAGLSGPQVRAVGEEELTDPLLRSAWEKVAERPRGVQTLLPEIGGDLREPVIDRLVARGLIRRQSRRMLGLFPTSTLLPADAAHRTALRRAVKGVLEDGETPDARVAALVALLSSSGTLPSLHPEPRWSGEVYWRGKEFENGSWGSMAVSTAMTRTAAAVAAASAAVTASVIT